ncbi:MAG: hypothetical protein COV07_01305 [Candidatus Vogelbacteria bacterium CG10_big_fil_rev_8_21_14_0_10_45_14]|uniref:Uncharacterized protein n=1 Tax=Candidatus Vogelbacteria bacterium CG10_big_fil_rev_8_21_14_0_10_45_14 TaxID=1975042 RepID=A0A2H0RKE1_9BACT|nr:MAG: hypothetical protein COV07_01305 [Candidatus Vogelbacteria bacterium CG10_big_fil_rev_8_21_14_0_10_45_14]
MKKQSIKQLLDKLESIAGWFEKEKDIDVEEGLSKVKEGALIVRELRAELKEVENEFEEIKKDLVVE